MYPFSLFAHWLVSASKKNYTCVIGKAWSNRLILLKSKLFQNWHQHIFSICFPANISILKKKFLTIFAVKMSLDTSNTYELLNILDF